MSSQSARPRTAAGGAAEPWTVLRMILWSADYLDDRGVESGRLDAEHLLAHAVGVDRLQLYLQFERPLTSAELNAYRPLLKRRAAREPLQYILGRQPFRELDLEVAPGVLIPRPETEVLVDRVLGEVSDDVRGRGSALDVGTGTGAIALSLAFEGSFASVVATDVDEGALRLARRNAESAGVGHKIDLRAGSLFEPLRSGERFDVIVSNPPYVAEKDEDGLQPEVVEWEPRQALFAGPDGFDVLEQIVERAREHLQDGGLLALEVGAGQATRVADMLCRAASYDNTRILRDYAGKERFVFARGA